MKTNLLTLAVALLLTAGAGKASFAESSASEKFIKLPGISAIEKIEARGNVDLYLLSGDSDLVEVDHDYYRDNALIQQENGVLRITNYRSQRLRVWVSVADLRDLSAYDDVSVTSLGKLSTLDLALDLYGRAHAKLDIDVINADLSLHQNSKADLKGRALESNLLINYAATANISGLLAGNMSNNRIAPPQKLIFRISSFAVLAPKQISQ